MISYDYEGKHKFSGHSLMRVHLIELIRINRACVKRSEASSRYTRNEWHGSWEAIN